MQSAFALSSVPHPLYTGVTVHETNKQVIDELHANKSIDLPPFYTFNENEYVIVKGQDGESALAKYHNRKLRLLDLKYLDRATDIKPHNKEQYFVTDALMDDAIKVVCLTGKAGCGKTLLALAAAIKKIEHKKYNKIILTKPSSQVGRRDLGILPGTLEEKFMPFLINYMCNFEVIFGDGLQKTQQKVTIEYIFNKYNIQIVPLQLIRGASFNNSLVIADEVQVLDYHEMLTLGTRMSEGSKLIILGDLNQRDEKISKENTGLFKFINSSMVKDKPFTASVHMTKCERGEVSALFSDVFETD